jgi:hypothetical protein
MGIVLANGPQVGWFKPRHGQYILRAIKICSTTSFEGGELWASCRKILQHNKDLSRYITDTDRQKAAVIALPFSPALIIGVFCNLSRDLWWINRE